MSTGSNLKGWDWTMKRTTSLVVDAKQLFSIQFLEANKPIVRCPVDAWCVAFVHNVLSKCTGTRGNLQLRLARNTNRQLRRLQHHVRHRCITSVPFRKSNGGCLFSEAQVFVCQRQHFRFPKNTERLGMADLPRRNLRLHAS